MKLTDSERRAALAALEALRTAPSRNGRNIVAACDVDRAIAEMRVAEPEPAACPKFRCRVIDGREPYYCIHAESSCPNSPECICKCGRGFAACEASRVKSEQFVAPRWREIVLGHGMVLMNDVTQGGVKGLAFIPWESPHPIGERVEPGFAGQKLDDTREDITVVWVHNQEAAKALHDSTADLLARFEQNGCGGAGGHAGTADQPHTQRCESWKDGAALISIERHRQVEQEGWTPQHDDEHTNSALIDAAICYATEHFASHDTSLEPPEGWPWDSSWWKPKDPVANLVRAGALIAAEIDRLLRVSPVAEAEQAAIPAPRPDASPLPRCDHGVVSGEDGLCWECAREQDQAFLGDAHPSPAHVPLTPDQIAVYFGVMKSGINHQIAMNAAAALCTEQAAEIARLRIKLRERLHYLRAANKGAETTAKVCQLQSYQNLQLMDRMKSAEAECGRLRAELAAATRKPDALWTVETLNGMHRLILGTADGAVVPDPRALAPLLAGRDSVTLEVRVREETK